MILARSTNRAGVLRPRDQRTNVSRSVSESTTALATRIGITSDGGITDASG
jgi:hypothetical protein